MNTVILKRLETGDDGTFGELTLPDGTTYHCAELPWRDNQPDVSCIQALPDQQGFVCHWDFSPHLNRFTYHLVNVAGHSGIRIHSGNFAGDTSMGYSSDILGCILPGLSVGQIPNHASTQQHPVMQKAVLQSTAATAQMAEKLNHQDFLLIIRPIQEGQNP